MKIEAIVYTSGTGNTEKYAKMIAERTDLPVYSAKEAEAALAKGAPVLYLGWIRASRIAGLQEAAARYAIAGICAVGMGETGGQIKELRKANKLEAELPLFTLQGGLFFNKLRGMNAFMINFSRKKAIKILKAEKKRTEGQNAMLIMLAKGGSAVQEKHLAQPLHWLEEQGVPVHEKAEEPQAQGGAESDGRDEEK